MAAPAPAYELVLMLDPEVEDERRDQIAAEARRRIEEGGSLESDNAWGMRKLAYEIRQRTEADYRFFRFKTGDELLDQLNHSLRITDGVLRFRIFKVDARSPVIVPPPPTPLSADRPPRGPRRGDDRGRREGSRRRDEGDSPRREEPAAAPSQPASPPTETASGGDSPPADPT